MQERIIVTANGRKLTFTGTHDIYLKWYNGWDADIGAAAKVTKDLPRGALCLDVGANIGMVSVTLAAQRPDFHIIAFEPVPENAECLRRNIRVNGIENVEVIEAAVSDCRGYLPMNNNGPFSAVIAGAPLQCRSVPLDDYADQPVAFVKIDVEGYEPNVFAGARTLFARQKPLVLVEFNALLLLHHRYDPVTFAHAIWSSFEILGSYYQENLVAVAENAFGIVVDNIAHHASVTDLLVRPRSEVPELDPMIYSAEFVALRREINTLRDEVIRSSRRPSDEVLPE